MEKNIKLILAVSLSLLFTILMLTPEPVLANNLPVVRVAVGVDESIIVERILHTALKRLGYQMITKTAGMRTTLNEVNYGEADVLPAHIIDLELEYENLIRIPVPISCVETNAYTLAEYPREFTSWRDLEGLRIGYELQSLHQISSASQAKVAEYSTFSDYESLWESLLAEETDVAVVSNPNGYTRVLPAGIKYAGQIEYEPRYTYVNKSFEYLVPLLTEEYQKMIDDGTMELIQNGSQDSERKIALHISSYSMQIEWERGEIESIRKVLDPNVEYHNINLNAHHVNNKANTSSMVASMIRTNYIENSPEILIVSDDDALEFVLNNYFMLFPNVPVVFCGINNFDKTAFNGLEEYITGVIEVVPVYDTISEMIKMYPQIKRIYVLNDYTDNGLVWREFIQQACTDSKLPIELVFSERKTLNEILNDIRKLDSDTYVLIGKYFLAGNNAIYVEPEVQRMVKDASKNPVFCLTDSYMGQGVLGGKLSVSQLQGQIAGEMINEILNGKKPSDIPIVTDGKQVTQWQFDYETAQLFDIRTNLLPNGHVAVNLKLKVWESNPLEFWLAVITGIFLLVIIAGLVLFARLMSQKNTHLIEIQSHLHSAEELLEKDKDLSRMIDLLPVSVLIVEISSYKPEYCNQAFLVENGLSRIEQASRLNLSQLMDKVTGLLKDSKTVSFNYGGLTGLESELRQKLTAESLVYNNKNCALLISEDISAHIKENEMLTNAAQKEKEANLLKSVFLANMSHEIRTPMNAIIGLSQLALIKPQSPENESFFFKIKSSAQNLLSIINDILDFSKIEAEKIDLIEAEFGLEETISNAFMVAVERVENKPLEILLDMAPDVPSILVGDSTRLWQVLKNLLDNAVKYTTAGQVMLGVEILGVKVGRVSLCFCITDTGMGMTMEQAERIFTPFVQLHQNDFKSKQAGTGLGMSITKQLVDLMNGNIKVSSRVGEGTQFRVTIPFKIPRKLKTINDITREISIKQSRQIDPVLIVDDNADSLRIMSSLLDQTGFLVARAANTMEALRAVFEKTVAFNTVIIDYLLGDESGLELAKKIKKFNPNCRVLLISDYTEQVESAHMINDAGIDDVIEKPYTPSVFMQKVCGVKAEIMPDINKSATYSKARVLLCEDNVINQIVASGILEEFGIMPTIAENGKEALELLDNQEFDLIFMDIIMPIMDGHEATTTIRASSKPYKNIPICALTANVMVDEVRRCISEGMNAHVEKPISFDAVAAVLADLLAPFKD